MCRRYYPEADTKQQIHRNGQKRRGKRHMGVGGNGGYLNPRIPLSNTNIYVKVYI